MQPFLFYFSQLLNKINHRHAFETFQIVCLNSVQKGVQQHAHAYIIEFPGTINYKQSRKVQSDTKYM